MRRERTKRSVPESDGTEFAPLGGRWAARADAFVSPRRTGESPIRTVLAAVDGTPFGEHAIPLAAAVARRAGAALRVVHVFSTRELAGEATWVMSDARWVFDLRRRRGEYLDGLVRRLERVRPLPVSGALLDGSDVAEAVCRSSATADLVVMATHDRSPWGRYWWGSVTAEVGRRARCPVLMVRGRDDAPDLGAACLPRDILVPLDGSARAEEAVRAAAAVGSLSGARYDLLRVIRGWPASGASLDGHRPLAPLPGESPEGQARQYLDGVAARPTWEGAMTTGRVVVDDRPVAEAIAGYAVRTGAELVALTTRGRGPLSRLFRGSVAEDVVCRVGVPVLLTRAQDEAASPG